MIVVSVPCNSFLELVSFRYLGSAGSDGVEVSFIDILQKQQRPKLS